MKSWTRLFLAALLALAGLGATGCGFLSPTWSVPATEAIAWHGEPAQTETRRVSFVLPTGHGDVTVHPRAAFDIAAVVASAEPYTFDDGAFLAPVDLVMTWGQLPEEPYRSKVSYSQMTRYYFWRTADHSLDLRYISTHSANMHMIPATRNLRRALAHVGAGEPVRVVGLLVDVEAPHGWRWNTSMTRNDTGPGACELVWVEELQRGDRLYR
jgi:hypothetical protein